MAKATLREIETLVASYVDANKINQYPFTATQDDVSYLVEKVALSFTNDSLFVDKLDLLDGAYLPFGNSVEEWQQDLILPTDDSDDGENTFSPSRPSYRTASYSYGLDKKRIKTTVDYYKFQKVFHNDAEYVSFITEITKRLFDSEAVFRYDAKRELLGKYAKACIDAMGTTSVFNANTAYATIGTYLKSASSNYTIGVTMKAIPASSGKTWSERLASGDIVEIDLVEELAVPVDETTGEAFIKQIKEDVEEAKDINEGHTLSGNANVAGDMVLFVKHGVVPSLEVDTQAGAFHLDKIAIPADLRVIKDFGSTGNTNSVYAILMDKRGARLFEQYRAVRTQENADGDFINYVLHTKNIAHYSKNTYIKVFKIPA